MGDEKSEVWGHSGTCWCPRGMGQHLDVLTPEGEGLVCSEPTRSRTPHSGHRHGFSLCPRSKLVVELYFAGEGRRLSDSHMYLLEAPQLPAPSSSLSPSPG